MSGLVFQRRGKRQNTNAWQEIYLGLAVRQVTQRKITFGVTVIERVAVAGRLGPNVCSGPTTATAGVGVLSCAFAVTLPKACVAPFDKASTAAGAPFRA